MLPQGPHRRLINEAAMRGADVILELLPVEYSRELELAIQQAVREAVLHYAEGMDTLDRQLHPVAYGKARA